jgi:hypothetical protein
MPSKSVPTKTTLKDFSIDQKKSGEFLLAEFNQLYELWRYIDKRIVLQRKVTSKNASLSQY